MLTAWPQLSADVVIDAGGPAAAAVATAALFAGASQVFVLAPSSAVQGVTTCADEAGLRESLRARGRSGRADIVLTLSTASPALRNACSLLRRGGALGLLAGPASIPTATLVQRELTVLPVHDLGGALQSLDQQAVLTAFRDSARST